MASCKNVEHHLYIIHEKNSVTLQPTGGNPVTLAFLNVMLYRPKYHHFTSVDQMLMKELFLHFVYFTGYISDFQFSEYLLVDLNQF